jgi:hypothetical protein
MPDPKAQAHHSIFSVDTLPIELVQHNFFIDQTNIAPLIAAVRDEPSNILFIHRSERPSSITISDNKGQAFHYLVEKTIGGLLFTPQVPGANAVKYASFDEFLSNYVKPQFKPLAIISDITAAPTPSETAEVFAKIKHNTINLKALAAEFAPDAIEQMSAAATKILYHATSFEEAKPYFKCNKTQQYMANAAVTMDAQASFEDIILANHYKEEIIANGEITLADPDKQFYANHLHNQDELAISSIQQGDDFPPYFYFYEGDNILMNLILEWIKNCYPDALDAYRNVKNIQRQLHELQKEMWARLSLAVEALHIVQRPAIGIKIFEWYRSIIAGFEAKQLIKTLSNFSEKTIGYGSALTLINSLQEIQTQLAMAQEAYFQQWARYNKILAMAQKVKTAAILAAEEENYLRIFECGITCDTMEEPATTEYGQTYEQEALADWLRNHDTDPNTNKTLLSKQSIRNRFLKAAINAWHVSKEKYYTTIEQLSICPLSRKPITDAVLGNDGITYDRNSLLYAKPEQQAPVIFCKNIAAQNIINHFRQKSSLGSVKIDIPSKEINVIAEPYDVAQYSPPPSPSRSNATFLYSAPPSAPVIPMQQLGSNPPPSIYKGTYFAPVAPVAPPFNPDAFNQIEALSHYQPSPIQPG